MGREAYLNLLALGRQCFEPQPASNQHENDPQQAQQAQRSQQDQVAEQNDQQLLAQPAPTSSLPHQGREGSSRASESLLDSQRAFRKAQNEVLTIVGIHLHKPRDGGMQRQIARENDMGLILSTLDLVSLYLMTWPLISIRNEIQTFRLLEDLSYMQILGVAFGQRRLLEWFAGIPSHIVFQIANIFRDYGQSILFRWLRKRKLFRDKTTGRPRKRLLSNLYKGLSMSLDLLFFPIYRHSVLQSLHLIPATPLFPSRTAFSPIPAGLLSLPLLEILRFAVSPSTYIESPFFWYIIQQKMAFRVHIKFLNFISGFLPRPNKFEEVKATGGYVGGDSSYGELTASEEEDNEETVRGDEQAFNNNGPGDRGGGVTQTFTATVQIDNPFDGGSSLTRRRRQTDASDISEALNGTEINEMSGQINEIEVQVTASTAREYAPGGGDQQNTTGSPIVREQERHYRDTQLASRPTDVIASHAADAVATSLTIGLESLVMRTTALSYLRAGTSGTIPRSNMVLLLAQRTASRRTVVPTRSLGLYGIYCPMETGMNWGTISKALALEWGVTWGFFEAAYWITTWVAVKWFGYK